MQEHKPLYLYSREEALRHGERDQWRDSYRENCDCARAIERAIAENYRDNCLGNCAGSILDRYGFTRVNWVLANTMQQKSYDGRFSEGNKRWAKQFYIPNDDIRWHFTVESHPGLTNLFVEQVRDAWQSLGLFDASHCLPDDSDQDYTGKVVVIDPNILKDKYKTLEDQLFLAEGGFGASPNSRGRKVYGTLPKIESAEMMFSASRSRRLQIVPIIQSFSQLDKNYGKEGSEIIVDNTQVTLFGGFAPNSSSAEILSKALGSRTVMSGSVSRSKNDPSQSLQMMERPLLTSDELKSLPKGDFVVMKTGVHPMKVHLKLFFKWGIVFDEKHPYSVPEHGNRNVQYAEKKEIQDGIMMKYHPKEAEEAEAAEKEASGGGQAQHQAEVNEPPQSEPPKEKKPRERKSKGGNLKAERHDRTAQEVLAEVTADGQA